ncbi:hypothetical protein CG709_19905, partial [Lachnotalea glycerini]
GSESNIMFSIYNTGKTIMYNVSVKFEADSISGGDTYVGKIQTGETGNVDAMVTAQAPSTDDGTVKVLITYEDESGNPTTVEKTLNLTVTEVDTSTEDDFDEDLMGEEEYDTNKSPIGIIIVIILIVAFSAGTVVFLKLRKKKKAAEIENDLMSEIDDVYEDDIDSVYEADDEAIESDQMPENDEATQSQTKESPQKEGDDDEIS